jgi:RNA polymerase sigma factor for flagellar operon FliA
MKSPGIRLYSESTEEPDNLVLANLQLVKRIALHLKVRLPPFVEFDDLLQAGMLGLIEASRSFHREKGTPFDSFARIRIKGSMIDYVRKQSYLPRTAVATRRSHAEATQTLTAELGRPPTQQEMAAFMKIDINDLQEERRHSREFETESIEEMAEAVDNLPDSTDVIPEIALEKAQLSANLVEAIEGLPEREKMILSLYYRDELTLKEIGAIMGVGESRISQILTKTALVLRKKLDCR